MKKALILITLLVCQWHLQAGPVTIETKNMSLILNAEEGKAPQYVYFGQRLRNGDAGRLQEPRDGRMDAYPAHGLNTPAEAAFAMRHADGNLSTPSSSQESAVRARKMRQ